MDEQRKNQKKLRADDRDDPNNAPSVLLPSSEYPVFDNTARWQIIFGKPPPLELTPVEHVNTGSVRFQHHLCRGFAVQNLNRGICGYFSGFRPTYNIATHGPCTNVAVRHRMNRRCRSSGQLSHYVKRKIAVACRVAVVFNRQHNGLSGQARDFGNQLRYGSICYIFYIEICFSTEPFVKLR